MEDLDFFRKKIDHIDDELIRLIVERLIISIDIGKKKKLADIPIYSPVRESAILSAVTGKFLSHIDSLNQVDSSHFSKRVLDEQSHHMWLIFKELFLMSRILQGREKVACLGPHGSFSYDVTRKHFGEFIDISVVNSIKGVFSRVLDGYADYGVVPIENTNSGAVNSTLSAFISFDNIYIQSVRDEKIQHCLLSISGDIRDIKEIYSHYQALSQCSDWLYRHFPNAVLKETSSTSSSADIALGNKVYACIGQRQLHSKGLKVCVDSIQDRKDNFTRFFIIGNSIALRQKNCQMKTSILIHVQDKIGILSDILELFKQNAINLINIQSHPAAAQDGVWKYIFFIDFLGYCYDSNVKVLLDNIASICDKVKILGSYSI